MHFFITNSDSLNVAIAHNMSKKLSGLPENSDLNVSVDETVVMIDIDDDAEKRTKVVKTNDRDK